MVKVEDWYKNGSTLVKTLRKGGKGRSPYADTTVKSNFLYLIFLVRMKVNVNGHEIFSNYQPGDVELLDDLRDISKEQRVALLEDPSLITYKINSYTLPSLFNKVIKSLKKNSVVEVTSTNITKLKSNFKSEWFDQYEFKEGDTINFTITLLDAKHTKYFYRNSAAEKLVAIKRLKGIAGEFFKLGNYSKAAKIYQRINGFY